MKLQERLNYFLPREIIGPVFIVFSLEHIIEILFSATIPQKQELYGWTALFIISIVLVAWWGLTDDDYKEFEEEEL